MICVCPHISAEKSMHDCLHTCIHICIYIKYIHAIYWIILYKLSRRPTGFLVTYYWLIWLNAVCAIKLHCYIVVVIIFVVICTVLLATLLMTLSLHVAYILAYFPHGCTWVICRCYIYNVFEGHISCLHIYVL